MSLSNRTKKALIASAHALNPVVIIGNQGITEQVLSEIERALYDHELIKVRVNAEDKAERLTLVEKMAADLAAEALTLIGHIVILYRQSDKKIKKVKRGNTSTKQGRKKTSTNPFKKAARKNIR
jgi:RNA-binding protein